MFFLLSAGDYSNLQNNTTKVKVHLRNGIAEVLENHTDLLGLIENDLVEVETFFENRLEKYLFVLEQGIFVVSNKGIGEDKKKNQTVVYVYAKRAEQISSTSAIEPFLKQYEIAQKDLEKATEKLELDKKNTVFLRRFAEAEETAGFLKRTIQVIKSFKA